MSELLSKINTNTGLIFSLKDQIDVSNAFFQQEITDLQNEKYDKTGGLISGDVDMDGNDILQVDTIQFQENIVLRGAKVAIGNLAGENNQGVNSVAIGQDAGQTNQGLFSVAVGPFAGTMNQSQRAVAIGNESGLTNQGAYAIAIGQRAGQNNQDNNSIVMNATGAVLNTNASNAFFVAPVRERSGTHLLQYDTSNNEICYSNTIDMDGNDILQVDTIQFQDGIVLRGAKVAIGNLTGETNQGPYAIAIGQEAGQNTQGLFSVAVGPFAGTMNQSQRAVAIGNESGRTNQGMNSVAIGERAGQNTQGANAIAIGERAGQNTQGANAIAIGKQAGKTNQDNNSIVMNATGAVLNTNASNAFFVAPVRERSGTHLLQYDTSNNEICYSNTIDVSGNLNITVDDIDLVATQGRFSIDSDTSRMEVLIGENFDGSNLALIADENGNEIISNTNLTIRGDGDVVIKNQTIGDGIIELNTENLTLTGASNGNRMSHRVSSTNVSNLQYVINPQTENGNTLEFYTIIIGNDDATQLVLTHDGNDNLASLSSLGKTGIGDYYEVENGTRIEVDNPSQNILFETENLTLVGSGIQDASAGSNSGQYLRIKLNGTFYKIALLDDI